jgi:hypothetical protein
VLSVCVIVSLLGVFYGTEDGSNMLHRYVSKLLPGYTIPSPRQQKMKAVKVAFSLESA